ncbi:general transcription factor II-I repeat domain-containing protein 2-like [Brienomyrus brachyistius]|uniref:general transcription factor II-I repeat domain-containing protein 2-like n=2 Tax=Brienomyrus brachyistius TaxID=42636 RepID=UPI0020B36665|nr:general transcription factor II-I repeat domain-containing protein 2-like [Brienomyrus brachyistius]
MERHRQWHTDKRHFKKCWEEEYFFTDINAKAVCLICNQSVAVLKEYNIRRHYATKHAAFSQFKGDARKNKTRELLAKLHRQQGTLTRPSTAQDSATRASFEITALIARTGRSFSTGDFVKECLSIAATIMCPSQAKTFSQISLSRNTVTRRIEEMSRDIKEQFKAKAAGFVAFSLACDESTDISDSAQLLVFIRRVNENMEITQELAGFETLRSTTKSEDLFAAVERVLDTNGLSWEKLVGITTDGAPAMVGRTTGLATLISQKVSQCGGKVAKYHCILHQEQLCARSVGMGDVVRDVIKIINCIRSKALSHRQFRALLEEVDSQYKDVLYHQEVRWLSRGKVLKRVFELRHVIAEFLTSKNSDTQVPTDEKWFCDVAFMVDITDLLNTLNIQLQGKDQIITELFDHITAFRSKLQLLCRHLSAGNLAHFPSLREVNLVKQRLPEYAALLRHLDQDFALRFEDFRESRGDMELFSQPFTISVDSVPDHIQMQLIEFQCDSELKNKFMSLHLKDFYTHVSSERTSSPSQ